MSAFLLAPERIEAIAAGIVRYYERHPAAAALCEGMPRTSMLLAEMLYRMNTDALEQRYGDSYPVEPFEHTGKFPRLEGVALLKAIHCLIYQCSEGNVPQTALYKALDQTATNIATTIVRELPEYNEAEWG